MTQATTQDTDGAAGSGPEPDLSVVVPVYEEEERIETCLDSILAACRGAGAVEVIVVDSNSADRTVELAADYPVTVLRITDDDLTTPGAGRYVGTRAARADRILFVDGDMRVNESWLDEALELLASDDDVAGVDGHLDDAGGANGVESVSSLNGVVLYDRDALERVGGFDPYMYSLEDVDVGFRLRSRGYRLLRTPSVAGHHPTAEGVGELHRRWRNGYFWGIGQAIRKSIDEPRVLSKHLWRFRYKLTITAWFGIGALGLLYAPLAALWLAATVAAYLFGVRRHGYSKATQRAIGYSLVVAGLVGGVTKPTPEPESFPLETAERVSEGRVLTGPERHTG